MKLKGLVLSALLFFTGSVGMALAQGATAAQYVAAGNQFYAAKDYAKAVTYYKYATTLDPNSAGAYQGLGNSYYGLGQKSDALAAYEKALQLNSNNPQLSSFVQTLKAQVGETAAPTGSASVPSSSSSASKFELDVNAGVAFATGITGFGGGLGGYFPLSTNFALGAMANFYTFSESASGYGATASASINFLEAMASAKYRFDGTGFRPYFFGGVGIADVMSSASASGGGVTISGSTSEVDPMIAIGGGGEFPAGPGMSIFIQGKYSVVFVPGTTVDTGYGTVTVGGGTSTYLPIEIGLHFDL